MGRVIFAMNTSVDGYVSGASGGPFEAPPPSDELMQYFNELQRSAALSLYGRLVYSDMRYWDTEDSNRSAVEEEFAAVWRATPKVVVSTTLTEVGPNATLVSADVDAELRRIVASTEGVISVEGPTLVETMSRLGLVDEYHIYQRPVVIGGGKPYFALGTTMNLTLLGVGKLPDDTVLVRYRPAT
ncbi:dihydrofolate reductase family protein [Smaragdicoccus niigatensis]|uniref:dihydrofolate reductase family protein n=1 Tax=Smaragdicoccus niigatensis TaxID=359359 RepID=UPI000367D091|nr:dihydrofolate reductase family protein [Smaragdicoccus niigatensis]